MSKTNVSMYLACPMTGLLCDEIWIKNINNLAAYEKEGIAVITPVMGEGIPFEKVPLSDRDDVEMHRVWKIKDKGAIRDTNILVITVPKGFSQGIFWEGILGRGTCWKPTVLVFEDGRIPGFISRTEADYVATSHREAALAIRQQWGTWGKRARWRINMLLTKLPSWIWQQLREFWI
jgi:hypothetical protein